MRLLGIDVGTTSLKAALFDGDGTLLASETVDYTLISAGDTVEMDPEVYWTICQQAIRSVCGDTLPDALAIDTQCETMILADEAGKPLMNAIVWLDNRAAAQATQIEKTFGRKTVYEVTGQPEITATWPACKLLWVKQNRPEIWSKVKKVFLLEDFLLYRLTGEFVTEKTLQSSSLYFDIRSGGWWKEMLDYLELPESALPRLEDSGVRVGSYQGCAVVTGAMDQIAGAIGSGIIGSSRISEMTGTTMVIFANSDVIPPYDPESIIPCHYSVGGKYCLLPWTSTAGMALKWFRNTFCENFSFRQLDDLAREVPAGSAGLVFLPYLCGSVMPKYNPDLRGMFCGIGLEHTRGHFARSVLESVACMLRENLEYAGLKPSEIRAMGGGAESPLWCQIKANITGIPLKTLKQKETACLGSAILAGVGIGVFSSPESAAARFAQTDREYYPQEDMSHVYENYQNADRMLQGGWNA